MFRMQSWILVALLAFVLPGVMRAAEVLAVWTRFDGALLSQNGLTLSLNGNSGTSTGVTIGDARGLTIALSPVLSAENVAVTIEATLPDSVTADKWLLGYKHADGNIGMVKLNADAKSFQTYNETVSRGTNYSAKSTLSAALTDGARHTFTMIYSVSGLSTEGLGTHIYSDRVWIGQDSGLRWSDASTSYSTFKPVNALSIGCYADGTSPFAGLTIHKVVVTKAAASYQDAVTYYTKYTPIYELSPAEDVFHNSTFVNFVTGKNVSTGNNNDWHLFSRTAADFPAETGATLLLTNAVTGKTFNAQFHALTFTGLIVEAGSTGNTFVSTDNNNRYVEFGIPNTSNSFYFTLHEDVVINRTSNRYNDDTTCYGSCYFEIDDGKTFTVNNTSDKKFILSEGSKLHLSGGGKLAIGSLEIKDDVTLDITGGVLDIAGGITVSGALHVEMSDAPAEEFKLLSSTSAPTLTTATATLNGVVRMLIAKDDGLYLAPSWKEDYNPVAVDKLIAVGGETITAVTGRHGNKELTAAEINASLELFSNIAKLATDGVTVEVNYHFGVSSVAVNSGKQIEATVLVQTAEGGSAVIAQGATVELYIEDSEGAETVLASTVLTADAETALLTTAQAYDEIAETYLSDESSSKTLNLKVRVKKPSVGDVSSSFTIDSYTGTVVAMGSPIELYSMTLASSVAANDEIVFSIDGTGSYDGQDYTLEVGGNVYAGTLQSGVVSFAITEAIAAGTQVTLSVADAAGSIEVLEAVATPVRIQKMLANTPEDDLNPNYVEGDESTYIFPSNTNGKAVSYACNYRIPAVATNGEGEIVAIYDIRYLGGDLGLSPTNVQWDTSRIGLYDSSMDIGESYSSDGGFSWAKYDHTIGEATVSSHVKIGINVPNTYNFKTIMGGDTSIDQGLNLNYATSEMDIGDMCILYDAPQKRYLAMGITGGGLNAAGSEDGGENNGVALYERGEGKDVAWTRIGENNKTFEAIALAALKTAYLEINGSELPSTKGFFQGPGHGMVTTQDVYADEELVMPKGTIVFPMQWFPQSGSSQACALYSTDGGNTWKATDLMIHSEAQTQENCIVELDDGSWLMVAKNGTNDNGRIYTRTTDFVNWSTPLLKAPARRVQGSIQRIGRNADGKSRYAMITATEGATGGNQNSRLNVRIFFATDDTDNDLNDSGIVWDDDSTSVAVHLGDTQVKAYSSTCYLEEGVLGVLYEARRHIYFERIDLRDKLNP